MKRLWSPFQVEMDGLPLTDHATPRIPGGGGLSITIRHPAELVSEYDLREAAIFACIPWPQFQDMHWTERVRVIAHYRMHNLIELHQRAHALRGPH